jgi:RNA polymerase-binding transcription factor DksA
MRLALPERERERSEKGESVIDTEATRQALEARRDQLVTRTGRIQGDLRKLRDPDSQERVTESENDEVLEGLDGVERAELERVNHALERLASGSYEECERCGGNIPGARLEAIPDTALCVGCA